ncbi:MAG: ParB/RepB/Spo0J family partition protein [Porticoccaceae bacterium]|nr:ParB/RepB/Spo0J family partition protein [Porticoccaceae bacterium]
MNTKRKGLGKGLDALLGLSEDNTGTEQTSGLSGDKSLRDLPIEWLARGRYQPRQDMNREALEELADSIREQGIMQPILVRQLEQDSYEIVAGERRWRAAQIAGLSTVPVLIRDLSDQDTLAMALIENIQRENLNAMEEAKALVRLQEEFGYTQEQVAKAVGKSRSAVANLIRLNSLQNDVALMLERGDLEMGHGRALLALSGQQQIETARMVASKGLSVRDTEVLVRRTLKHKENPDTAAASDPDISRLEQQVSVLLGAGVKIAHRSGGKGKMTITYNSVEELEGILEHIK